MNDNELKLKIGNYKFSEGLDFVALEFHHQCRRDYLNKARDYKRKTENENSGTIIQMRKSDVMIEMVTYIKDHVISKDNHLQRFKQLYIANEGKPQNIESYSVQQLTWKIKKEFNQNEIGIKADGRKKTVIWKNTSMTLTHATHLAKQNQSLEANIIWICTSRLRNDILPLESVPMTESISVNSIIKRKIDPPESVQNF